MPQFPWNLFMRHCSAFAVGMLRKDLGAAGAVATQVWQKFDRQFAACSPHFCFVSATGQASALVELLTQYRPTSVPAVIDRGMRHLLRHHKPAMLQLARAGLLFRFRSTACLKLLTAEEACELTALQEFADHQAVSMLAPVLQAYPAELPLVLERLAAKISTSKLLAAGFDLFGRAVQNRQPLPDSFDALFPPVFARHVWSLQGDRVRMLQKVPLQFPTLSALVERAGPPDQLNARVTAYLEDPKTVLEQVGIQAITELLRLLPPEQRAPHVERIQGIIYHDLTEPFRIQLIALVPQVEAQAKVIDLSFFSIPDLILFSLSLSREPVNRLL